MLSSHTPTPSAANTTDGHKSLRPASTAPTAFGSTLRKAKPAKTKSVSKHTDRSRKTWRPRHWKGLGGKARTHGFWGDLLLFFIVVILIMFALGWLFYPYANTFLSAAIGLPILIGLILLLTLEMQDNDGWPVFRAILWILGGLTLLFTFLLLHPQARE